MIFGPIKMILRIISLFVTIVVLYFAVTFVQIYQRGRSHSTQDAQAILVFGTTQDNGVPSPELAARLGDALNLYRAHRAPFVAVTGGQRPGDTTTEADVSALWLEHRGVPINRVIIGSGADTWQNVESVMPALKKRHISTVLVVTDPFHEYRAMANASAQGLVPSPAPVAHSPITGHALWGYYLRETVAVGVGRIIGYGRLSQITTRVPLVIPSPGG